MSYYGYARVSSKDQNLERQIVALMEYGVPADKIFCDKQSGKNFDRIAYIDLLNTIKAGHALVIKSIDRLGRNYDEILEQWRIITKEKGINMVVLDMPLLNTNKKKGDPTDVLIADLVLQILSYVANQERIFIKQRQKEGIRIAKNKGVKFGRPPKKKPENFESIKEKYENGEMTSRQAAFQCGVCQSTFLAWMKKFIT